MHACICVRTAAGTYESVCRRHIQSFMEGAELYARCYTHTHILPDLLSLVFYYMYISCDDFVIFKRVMLFITPSLLFELHF